MVDSHQKLNILETPIAKKYCEGKVKRTLKRRSKELEIVEKEAKMTCNVTHVLFINTQSESKYWKLTAIFD